MQVRSVTPEFAVSPQIAVSDLPALARDGFTLVVNNRPDGEEAGQPTSAQIESACRAAGLGYVHIPVQGPPGPEQAAALRERLDSATGPVLAFCRSGTRSLAAWALAETTAGKRTRPQVIALAETLGYDLSKFLA